LKDVAQTQQRSEQPTVTFFYLLPKNAEHFLEKKSQRNGPFAETLQYRKSKRTRQKNKSGYRNGESNDSPEIQDRRYTSEITGLASGFESGKINNNINSH